MFKKKETHIDSPLNEFLRQAGLETPLLHRRLIASWPEVVGDYISQQTGDIVIKNQTLVVKIFSPALRQELSMYSTKLTENLNNKVGSPVISNIRFY